MRSKMMCNDPYEMTPEQLLDAVRARFEAGTHTVSERDAQSYQTIIDDYEDRCQRDNLYYWCSDRMRELYRLFSPDEVKYREEFATKFVGERAAKYRAACKYYRLSGYYHYTIAKVSQEFLDGDDEAYTPTPKDFKQLTENKYFPKIWAAKQSEPKYAVGDFICFRAASALPVDNPLASLVPYDRRRSIWRMKDFAGQAGFILQVAPVEPQSAAKGSKVYKILLAGKTTPMYVEERHIKKGKLPKKK